MDEAYKSRTAGGAEVARRISNFTDKGPNPYSPNSNGAGCTIVRERHKFSLFGSLFAV